MAESHEMPDATSKAEITEQLDAMLEVETTPEAGEEPEAETTLEAVVAPEAETTLEAVTTPEAETTSEADAGLETEVATEADVAPEAEATEQTREHDRSSKGTYAAQSQANAGKLRKKQRGTVVRERQSTQRRPGIIREPAVLKRLEQRSAIEKITSNGTIAAAVMVVSALLAVAVANSPFYEIVLEILEAPMTAQVGPIVTTVSIEVFINDFLMAVFFLLVGIELKYEMTVGQLRRPRQAMLPMLAAVGGVAVPALIYIAFNLSGGEVKGWAVPIATDIAFALGVMSLLGDKVAPETKVFFQTLAIADDILAILVLALFYGQTPSIAWCAASLVVIIVLWGLNRNSVYSLKPYCLVGLALWYCMFKSGIHATLSGVILAFFLPARSDVRLSALRDWLGRRAKELDDRYDDKSHVLGQHDFTESAYVVERVMHHVTPPLERAERNISVLVNFLILPIFAFANAQIRFVGADFGAIVSNSVTQGVFFGAVLGKPLGIVAVTFLLVKIGFAKLPKNVTWDQVISVGIMGGLGFTMSILISGLAFSSAFDVMSAKVAILAGSFAAAGLGVLFVEVYHAITTPKVEEPEEQRD